MKGKSNELWLTIQWMRFSFVSRRSSQCRSYILHWKTAQELKWIIYFIGLCDVCHCSVIGRHWQINLSLQFNENTENNHILAMYQMILIRWANCPSRTPFLHSSIEAIAAASCAFYKFPSGVAMNANISFLSFRLIFEALMFVISAWNETICLVHLLKNLIVRANNVCVLFTFWFDPIFLEFK